MAVQAALVDGEAAVAVAVIMAVAEVAAQAPALTVQVDLLVLLAEEVTVALE
jgi:hypothetical protein